MEVAAWAALGGASPGAALGEVAVLGEVVSGGAEDSGVDSEGGDEGSSDDMGGGYGGGNATTSTKSSYDMPVELYGIIYIYNPVAEKKLGIELKEADPSAVPTSPTDSEPVTADNMNVPAPGDTDMALN